MINADITWANSAAAGTVVNVDVPGAQAAVAAVTVRNPSAVTALTVKVQGKETLGGAARYPEIASLAVPANTTKQFFIDEMWLVGEGGRLAVTNDTLLGAGDGFTGQVRVRVR
jgi:redox-regulated HSP33 family molecular chaperone